MELDPMYHRSTANPWGGSDTIDPMELLSMVANQPMGLNPMHLYIMPLDPMDVVPMDLGPKSLDPIDVEPIDSMDLEPVGFDAYDF